VVDLDWCLGEIDRRLTAIEGKGALLRDLEWSGGVQAGLGDGVEAVCPSCGAERSKGLHASDCKLARAIGADRWAGGWQEAPPDLTLAPGKPVYP
jgi:hypothetical protein